MENQFVVEDQTEKLAHSLLEEYLHSAGYSFDTLGKLTPAQIKQLMSRASVYVSVKLAEIEDRAQVVQSLHHATDSAR